MTVVGKDFVFVHVPKSAGKSVAAFLGGTTKGIPGHAPLWYLRQSLGVHHFAFGTVRNPWARMVSAYMFITQKPLRRNDPIDEINRAKSLSFKDWLLHDEFFSKDDELWRQDGQPGFQRRSQSFWLKGCDEICRVENLEVDLQRVLPNISVPKRGPFGLLGPAKLKHKNQSIHTPFQSYYDAESVDFVAAHSAWEIETFGYSFE